MKNRILLAWINERYHLVPNRGIFDGFFNPGLTRWLTCSVNFQKNGFGEDFGYFYYNAVPLTSRLCQPKCYLCQREFNLYTWGKIHNLETHGTLPGFANFAPLIILIFLAAKGAALGSTICGVSQSVLANMQIYLSPFKCQLFHLFIVD